MNKTFVCDPWFGNDPQPVNFYVDLSKDWLMWNGQQREIADIHRTKNGVQIQLV